MSLTKLWKSHYITIVTKISQHSAVRDLRRVTHLILASAAVHC